MIPHAQRFGSVTDITYKCDECYTGGGTATCENGEWSHDGNCDSKRIKHIYHLLFFLIM